MQPIAHRCCNGLTQTKAPAFPAGAFCYHIWVSEIMLQQTRVAAAIPYYERFIAALPNPAALAACEPDALRKLWQGLGYYNRVNNMQKAARIVCEQYGGDLPADYDALRSLPGIGDYTAGAVASIAFGIPASGGGGRQRPARFCPAVQRRRRRHGPGRRKPLPCVCWTRCPRPRPAPTTRP